MQPYEPIPAQPDEPAPEADENCPLLAFKDLDRSQWYHDGIHWALENGVMNGVGRGLFAPDRPTTRAMIVTMLHRMEGGPGSRYGVTFMDVAGGEWYTEAVRWAAENGIVNGYCKDTFGPDDQLTREQLATILYRYARTKGLGFTGMWAFPLTFDDAADVSDWAYEAVCWMTMQGIIRGTGANRLSPMAEASRAQVAAMLTRLEAVQA